jgi:hypothetical protein
MSENIIGSIYVSMTSISWPRISDRDSVHIPSLAGQMASESTNYAGLEKAPSKTCLYRDSISQNSEAHSISFILLVRKVVIHSQSQYRRAFDSGFGLPRRLMSYHISVDWSLGFVKEFEPVDR